MTIRHQAPYSLPDATEYGVEYVLVEDNAPPRKVTVWSGVERAYCERLVHHMRNRVPPRGVRYVRPRLVTRPFPQGAEVLRMRREERAAATPLGKGWIDSIHTVNPYHIPTENWYPLSFWRPSRTERYMAESGLEEWMHLGDRRRGRGG